ncbi:hypothetical protein HAX54_034353, partial [Datura stramonium]|nr:hypothetical protein [Datura stramonium]
GTLEGNSSDLRTADWETQKADPLRFIAEDRPKSEAFYVPFTKRSNEYVGAFSIAFD